MLSSYSNRPWLCHACISPSKKDRVLFIPTDNFPYHLIAEVGMMHLMIHVMTKSLVHGNSHQAFIGKTLQIRSPLFMSHAFWLLEIIRQAQKTNVRSNVYSGRTCKITDVPLIRSDATRDISHLTKRKNKFREIRLFGWWSLRSFFLRFWKILRCDTSLLQEYASPQIISPLAMRYKDLRRWWTSFQANEPIASLRRFTREVSSRLRQWRKPHTSGYTRAEVKPKCSGGLFPI